MVTVQSSVEFLIYSLLQLLMMPTLHLVQATDQGASLCNFLLGMFI